MFSTYLLISFYFFKDSANLAGLKAFITSRIGDIGLIAGIMLIFAHSGTFMFTDAANMTWAGEGSFFYVLGEKFAAGEVSLGLLTSIGIFMFIGAIGKSGLFPLHTWISGATKAPVPVNAIIHTATMGIAGVFLCARLLPLLTPGALSIIALIGGFTALIAATLALVQTNIKKILAYSAISQLGFVFLAIGTGNYTAAIFYFFVQAFFNGLLFLSSGSLIHALHGETNINLMGGLIKKLPWTFMAFLVGTFALVGVPGFSGFYAKQAVLSSALLNGNTASFIGFIFALLDSAITAFYMLKLIFTVFFGTPKNFNLYTRVRESRWIIIVPLLILSGFSLAIGWAFGEKFSNQGFFSLIFSAKVLLPVFSIASVIFCILFLAKLGTFKTKQTIPAVTHLRKKAKEFIPQHKLELKIYKQVETPESFKPVPILIFAIPLICLFIAAFIGNAGSFANSVKEIPTIGESA